ncbi:hypothetical protein N9W17_05910 [Jannaschia sp.]|nr:hypothetical protein [Jannaschia sp.]
MPSDMSGFDMFTEASLAAERATNTAAIKARLEALGIEAPESLLAALGKPTQQVSAGR